MKDITTLKNIIVTLMFIDSADQDYVVSRWSFLSRLMEPFFWNAGQSLEKYLKAILLLNGKTSKGYGHDLERLYNDILPIVGHFLPKKLCRPRELDFDNWRDETTWHFISRFNRLCDPNNRYNMLGFVQQREDLAHLDQVVFSLRRVAVDLNAYPGIGKPNPNGRPPRTYREILEQLPSFDPRLRGSKLGKIAGGGMGKDLQNAALNFNFCFSDSFFEHSWKELEFYSSSEISVLARHILRPAEYGSNPVLAEACKWVLGNIHLPDVSKSQKKKDSSLLTVRMQIEQALCKLRGE